MAIKAAPLPARAAPTAAGKLTRPALIRPAKQLGRGWFAPEGKHQSNQKESQKRQHDARMVGLSRC